MVTRISKSPEETERLGQEAARNVRKGDVIGLIGDLGAGKTQFVKGLVQGLGISDRIHSPTFALVNEYLHGSIPCFHLDLYRLDTPQQIVGAGLEEYLYQRRGVTVIEWFDRWLAEPTLPRPASGLLVTILTTGENQRMLRYEDFGA